MLWIIFLVGLMFGPQQCHALFDVDIGLGDIKDWIRGHIRDPIRDWAEHEIYDPLKGWVDQLGDVVNDVKGYVDLLVRILKSLGYSLFGIVLPQLTTADHVLNPSCTDCGSWKLRFRISNEEHSPGCSYDNFEILVLKYRAGSGSSCYTKTLNTGTDSPIKSFAGGQVYEWRLPDNFKQDRAFSLSVGRRGQSATFDKAASFDSMKIGMLVLLKDDEVKRVIDFNSFEWLRHGLDLGSSHAFYSRIDAPQGFSAQESDNAISGVLITGKRVEAMWDRRLDCDSSADALWLQYNTENSVNLLSRVSALVVDGLEGASGLLGSVTDFSDDMISDFQSQVPSVDHTCDLGGDNDVSLVFTVPSGGGQAAGGVVVRSGGECYDNTACGSGVWNLRTKLRFGSGLSDLEISFVNNDNLLLERLQVYEGDTLYHDLNFKASSKWAALEPPGLIKEVSQSFRKNIDSVKRLTITKSGKVSWSNQPGPKPCSDDRKRRAASSKPFQMRTNQNLYSIVGEQLHNIRNTLSSGVVADIVDGIEDMGKFLGPFLKLLPDAAAGTLNYFGALPFRETYGAACIHELIIDWLDAVLPPAVVEGLADLTEYIMGAVSLLLNNILEYSGDIELDLEVFGAGQVTFEVLHQVRDELSKSIAMLPGNSCPVAAACYIGQEALLVPPPRPCHAESRRRRRRSPLPQQKVRHEKKRAPILEWDHGVLQFDARLSPKQGVPGNYRSGLHPLISVRNRAVSDYNSIDRISDDDIQRDPASWPVVPNSWFHHNQNILTATKTVFNTFGSFLWKVSTAHGGETIVAPLAHVTKICWREFAVLLEFVGKSISVGYSHNTGAIKAVNSLIAEYNAAQSTSWDTFSLDDVAGSNIFVLCSGNKKADFDVISVHTKRLSEDGTVASQAMTNVQLSEGTSYALEGAMLEALGVCRQVSFDQVDLSGADVVFGADVFIADTGGWGKNGVTTWVRHAFPEDLVAPAPLPPGSIGGRPVVTCPPIPPIPTNISTTTSPAAVSAQPTSLAPSSAAPSSAQPTSLAPSSAAPSERCCCKYSVAKPCLPGFLSNKCDMHVGFSCVVA